MASGAARSMLRALQANTRSKRKAATNRRGEVSPDRVWSQSSRLMPTTSRFSAWRQMMSEICTRASCTCAEITARSSSSRAISLSWGDTGSPLSRLAETYFVRQCPRHAMAKSGKTRRPVTSPHAGDHDREEQKYEPLHHGERRSTRRIARRQRMQRRDFQETLDHQHEHVQVERDQCGYYIDWAPSCMPYSARQATESNTSERMPMICDGNSRSNGNMKPVTLVRMVNTRKIAVRAGIGFESSMPNMTMRPATIAIRLMTAWMAVTVDKLRPSITTRSPAD